MRVLVTGSDGFIGKNLVVKLREKDVAVVPFGSKETFAKLQELIGTIDFIIHLAGVNRPKNVDEFAAGNSKLTHKICDLIIRSGFKIPILFSSSIQAGLDNPYGISKLESEQILLEYSKKQNIAVYIYRLPNVFGKWCRPNYNSVVATFCYNIINDLPIHISDANVLLRLVYVDDVISAFVNSLQRMPETSYCEVSPIYSITVGKLAEQLKLFKTSRKSMMIDSVGYGLSRALYSTYVSYLGPKQFSYCLPKHEDARGFFVEVLKTKHSGQFSYFTAFPGITRGGHYHHTKTEKFLVVKGEARFCFRNIITGEKYSYCVSDTVPEVVETVPGWVHNITNIGNDEMIVLLWANEIFDHKQPDTIVSGVE